MTQERPVEGGIIVHARTELYTINAGAAPLSYSYIDGTYTGDIDGPAVEGFIVAPNPDGSHATYGMGTFTGRVLGRSGTLIWKFVGEGGNGVIEILSGTGELAGLTGTVPYMIKPGSRNEFTYSGVVSG